MSEPRNICPTCNAPFTLGSADIGSAEDIKIHYWWHKLEVESAPAIYQLPSRHEATTEQRFCASYADDGGVLIHECKCGGKCREAA